ncbi:MAG: NADH-quinone oxidoreductase subunit NuoK [Proteobacteria bacterium]|nr:NADH-quinone oxidoreductase subunit NuoK [Pseudomonadota bacterium]NBY21034.1 NADH-quinone oxidoreductase subunit NuoK [bacterium]
MQFSSSLQGYLAVGAILFSLGVFCVLTRKNAIGILLGIELILNAAGINFVAFSKFRTGLIDGQIVALFIMLIAAAEAAVALAVILRFYRLKQTIDADEASIMRN